MLNYIFANGIIQYMHYKLEKRNRINSNHYLRRAEKGGKCAESCYILIKKTGHTSHTVIKFFPKLWTLTVHDVVCVHAPPSSLVQKNGHPKWRSGTEENKATRESSSEMTSS